jgi:hypothetical protein
MGSGNGGQQVLGMRSGSGHHGSQLSNNNEGRLSKKENDFQKLNKQSTMLYLHHNPN